MLSLVRESLGVKNNLYAETSKAIDIQIILDTQAIVLLTLLIIIQWILLNIQAYS